MRRPHRLCGSCPLRHSAPDSPVPGPRQSWSRADTHLGQVCSVQEDIPLHISLRAGWLQKQRQVRTHGGRAASRPAETSRGQPSQESGPWSPPWLSATLGPSAAGELGTPFCAPQDIPLGKEARLSPPSGWVRDGDTTVLKRPQPYRRGQGRSDISDHGTLGCSCRWGRTPRCSGPKWKQLNRPGGLRTPAVGLGVGVH